MHAEQQKADGREAQDRAMLKREVRGTRVHCEEAHHTTRKHQQALLCSLSVPLLLCALAVVFARCVRDESESHVLLACAHYQCPLCFHVGNRVNGQEMEGDSMQQEIGSEAHGEIGGDGF